MHGRLAQFGSSAALGAILALTVCVTTPLTLYAGNHTEFTASFLDIAEVYLPFILLFILLAGMLGALMSVEGFRRYFGMVAALAVLAWVQGNLLVWEYGPLDGSSIAWLEKAWLGALDSTIWVLVLILGYVHVRFRKLLVQAAVATFAIQALMVALTIVPRADELLLRSQAESNIAGREAIARFSPERNVVHIVMDGFQSDVFSEIVNAPENRELREKLPGFTFFPDNMGVFPYTQMTVPAFLSSKIYQNHMPAEEFIANTLRGNTILSAAADNGYQVDIAASVGLKNVYSLGRHTNSYGITANSHVTEADYAVIDSAKLMDLALFRVVPHFAKALVYRDELWIFQSAGRTSDFLQMQYFSDLAFLQELRAEMTADRDMPVYKLLHLMLSHRPTVGNGDCEFDGIKPTSRRNVRTQAQCGLIHVLNLFERMQELDIYDDSLIVMMADHGAWVPAEGVRGLSPRDEGADVEIGASTIGMAVPVLAIKRPGDTGELRNSDTPTSVVDIPATIASILELDATFGGSPAFNNHHGTRERRHLTYAYGENPDYEGYYFPMREYVVIGSVFDAAAWQSTRLFRPEGIVENL